MCKKRSFWQLLSCSFISLCLIFSLVFTTGVSRVSAAEIPVATPSSFKLLQTLFMALGIAVSGSSDSIDSYYSQLNDHKNSLTDENEISMFDQFIGFIGDIGEYWSEKLNALIVPQDVWNTYRGYTDYMINGPDFTPVNDVPGLTMFNKNELVDYVSSKIGSCPEWALTEFTDLIFNHASNHSSSGIFYKNISKQDGTIFCYAPIDVSYISRYSFLRIYDGASSHFWNRVNDVSLSQKYALTISPSGSYSVTTLFENNFVAWGIDSTSNSVVYNTWVYGKPYDFYDLWKYPMEDIPDKYDYGNTITLQQFDFSVGIDLGDDVEVKVDDDVADYTSTGTLDVVTPGRDVDDNGNITGDVTITLPSDSVLQDYNDGDASLKDVLDDMGVNAVDTSTNTEVGTGTPTKDLVDTSDNNNSWGGWLGDLLDGLIDLFVPSSEFWQNWFNRLLAFFEAKLGLLYTPIDILVKFLNKILTSEPKTAILHFPGLTIPFEGENHQIAEEQDVSLDMSSYFPGLQDMIHFVTTVMMIAWVLSLGQRKLKEMIST